MNTQHAVARAFALLTEFYPDRFKPSKTTLTAWVSNNLTLFKKEK
jgi:hypothetical protein